MNAAARAAGRRTALAVAAALALPFVLATLLWAGGWRPPTGKSHGELLAAAPVSPRPSAAALQEMPANATFAAFNTSTTRGERRWLLALLAPGVCAAACVDQLHLARQVQVSLNKNMSRVSRVLIGPDPGDEATLAALRARWPDLVVTRLAPEAWAPLAPGGEAPRLIVVDPEGRPVLRYAASPDPAGVRRDLERLLRYSWLG